MDDTDKAEQAVDLISLGGQARLYEMDDEPTLGGAPFARCLAKPFIQRARKGDVLSNVGYHDAMIHTTPAALHTTPWHGRRSAIRGLPGNCRAVLFSSRGRVRRLAVSRLGTYAPDIPLDINQNATAKRSDQTDLHGTEVTLQSAEHVGAALDPAAYRNCHGGVRLGR